MIVHRYLANQNLGFHEKYFIKLKMLQMTFNLFLLNVAPT